MTVRSMKPIRFAQNGAIGVVRICTIRAFWNWYVASWLHWPNMSILTAFGTVLFIESVIGLRLDDYPSDENKDYSVLVKYAILWCVAGLLHLLSIGSR